MVYELGIGGALAIAFFVLQNRISTDVSNMTIEIRNFIKQKAELERKYKTSECKRIIEHLQEILENEKFTKEWLTNYPVGDSIDKFALTMYNFNIENAVRSFTKKIEDMKDAMRQLEGKLNDTYLRQEFLEYVGSFNYLPRHIVERKILEQEEGYHREGLVAFIKEQIPQIEELIKRFTKEMESSLAERSEENKSVARKVLDQSKYFNAPKL